MSDFLLTPTPTSQNTVQPFTTPDTLSGSSQNFGLSSTGEAALALAHQEQDAREGLCDYPAPFTCEDCGAQAVEMRLYPSEIAWLCTVCSGDEPDPPAAPARPQPDLSDPPRCTWCCCQPGIGILECVDCTSNYDAPTLHPSTEGLLCSACAAEAARCERCHSLTRPLVERVDSEGETALYCEGGCEPTEETLPEDLPSYNPPGDDWEPWPERDPQVCDPVVAYPAGDYRIGDAEDLLGGVTALRALTACPSEISEGGTEVLLSHLDPLPAPPRPWWWTALCALREQGDIQQQIAYLESVIRSEARRLVPTAPPDDPEPHPALQPLTGQESVDLYRAAAMVGRLGEVLAAVADNARLRELYSVLCGPPAPHLVSGSIGAEGRTSRQGSATEEALGAVALFGILAWLALLLLTSCGEREGRPVIRPLDCADFGLSPDSCL